MFHSLGFRRIYLRVFRMTFGPHRPLPAYPNTPALYPVPVRRIRVMAFASFRSHLTVDTLARPRGSRHWGPQGTLTPKKHNMPGAQKKVPDHKGLAPLLRGPVTSQASNFPVLFLALGAER